MLTKINEITAKSNLHKSGLPGADWDVNPYNGCQFGCQYCYAAQIARWKHPGEEWGSFLDVKINAPKLLRHELEKTSRKLNSKDFGFIFFSSVTDPYTSIEAKYHLTRQCLQAIADFGYEGQVGIQTKSPLVLQDIDVLTRLKKVEVGFTITTLDDKVSRFLESFAPPVSARLEALKKLHQVGISTYAFIGPILPHFVTNESAINQLLDELEKVGVGTVWFEHLNQSSQIKSRLYDFLNSNAPELIADFEAADTSEYRQRLNDTIHRCLHGRSLKLGLGQVIFHHSLPSKN